MELHKYYVSLRKHFQEQQTSVTSLEREHGATQAADCVTGLKNFSGTIESRKEDAGNTELKGISKFI
jgi:hypothetical protein